MKLASFIYHGARRLGAVTGDGIIDLNAADASLPADMLTLLQGGDAMMARARTVAEAGGAKLSLADVELESPVPNPPRIFAVALNYMDHYYEIPDAVREAHNVKPPEIPVIFNKQTTSANGPYGAIHLPAESS